MTLLELIKQNPKIHGENGYINSIRKKITSEPISDITDAQGHQYVDLVMEGGTVWGLALIGYTYTLEQAGIRFLNLAGTSAGSINAMILAVLGQSSSPKSEKLLEIFDKMDLKSFVDGGTLASELTKDLEQKDNPWTAMLPKLFGLISIGKFGKDKLGINPGKKFEDWLHDRLNENGITNTEQLFQKLRNNGLEIRADSGRRSNSEDVDRFQKNFLTNELAIIASDISTQSKITFPHMAKLYWDDPLKINPKFFVRASMSIPLFFEPVRLGNLPMHRTEHWKALTGYSGTIPEVAYLVDGGVISNFPIDVFHSHDCVPLCPTFGAKLGKDREFPSTIENISGFATAIIETLRHNNDFTFIFKNEDYKLLITNIDTSQKYTPNALIEKKSFLKKITDLFTKKESDTFNSMDFNMSDEKKAALFALGANAAYEFICGNKIYDDYKNLTPLPAGSIPPFDWKAYKDLRARLKVSDTEEYRARKQRIEHFSLLP